jgi:hypothetical protein
LSNAGEIAENTFYPASMLDKTLKQTSTAKTKVVDYLPSCLRELLGRLIFANITISVGGFFKN